MDLTEFRLVRNIPLDAVASEVVLGRNGKAFTVTPENGTVHIIDPRLQVAQSGRLSSDLSGIALSPDGRSLIGVAPHAQELIVTDATSLQVSARYKLSGEPKSICVPPAPQKGESAKPKYAAVATDQGGTVELFDYGTGQRWSHDLNGTVGALRFRADGQRLLAANLQTRCITALTAPDLENIADLPVAMEPENLCFNADQGQLFVSGPGMDAVAIIFPYNTLQVDQTVLAGRDPGVMACSEDPAYLFVGSKSGSNVSILNIDTRNVIGIVDTGQRPTYITVTPDSQYALVLNEGGGTMAVIHIPDIVSNAGDPFKWRYKFTAGLFTLLPVGDKPVSLAVVPKTTQL